MKKIFFALFAVFCMFGFSSCVIISDEPTGGVKILNDSGFSSGYVITDVYVSKDNTDRGEKVFTGCIEDFEYCYVNLEPGDYFVTVDFEDGNYIYKSNWAGRCQVSDWGYVTVALDSNGNLYLY